MKKWLVLLLPLPLLLAGCRSTFTNLTPQHQLRTTNNLYQVEVAFDSRKQTIRWNSIRPQIVAGTAVYPMRITQLMTNRWEGLIPVPPGMKSVHYRYKFEYDYNAFGKPKTTTEISPEYSVSILEK